MYRGIIIFFGILVALSSVIMGLCSVVAWEIVAVLVAVSLGIPSLMLTYEKVKPTEEFAQGKAERKHEKERIKPPSVPLKEGEKQKSALLPDNTAITKLNIDDNFLDQIYEEARSEAVSTYDDAKLSHFAIQVFPFEKDGPIVNIYFSFYSKWANKICEFQYSDLTSSLMHVTPNRQAILDYQRGTFKGLPWKTAPRFLQALNRSYDKIKPLSSVKETHYQLSIAASKKHWSIQFEDGVGGNPYWFDWDGQGLDENSIKQTH